MAPKICTILLGLSALFAYEVSGINFPWEAVQLNQSAIGNFSAIRFGNAYQAQFPFGRYGGLSECRAFPGSKDWPADVEWARLNATIDGALLKPRPAAAACYAGPGFDRRACQFLTRIATYTHYWLDDPLDVLTQWPEGNTCLASMNAKGNCTQGGYPVYVVNATTVKHIQAAVNFARNENLRIVIKNTGHDFGGRSVGAGALSIWVHNLKSFEFLPQYKIGQYSGMAVRYGAGVESWELFNHMAKHNISVLAPGGSTVGALGGWLALGGHGSLTSYLGLGSDQALSIEVVTADGRLVTADPYQNTDLFFALRGGGPSTYGVMTSVVMKAFPPINMTSSSVNIQFNTGAGPRPPLGFPAPLPPSNGSNPFLFPNGTNPFFPNGTFPNITFPFPFPNGTGLGNGTWPPIGGFPMPGATKSADTFWKGVSLYYRFGKKVVEAGGMCYGYIYPIGNGSFSFTSNQFLPNVAPERAQKLVQPLYDELSSIGIHLSNPVPRFAAIYGSGHRDGGGDGPVQTRYRSRLFPRENWEDDDVFNSTVSAIRKSIEAGYTFHGIMYSPTREVAGWPGRSSAVNPAWRNALLHASLMETQPVGLSAMQANQRDDQARKQLDTWRAVTPGSGAYLNEGDPAEPNWQQSFYGDLYSELLVIKRRRDPWGLFWAPTTVGSEAWEVRPVDGYPGSQNGRLCRVAAPVFGGGDGGGDDAGDDGDDDDN